MHEGSHTSKRQYVFPFFGMMTRVDNGMLFEKVDFGYLHQVQKRSLDGLLVTI